MKDGIIQRLVAVQNALGEITVKGEQNLDNLTGCIKVIRETVSMLNDVDVVKREEKKPEKT